MTGSPRYRPDSGPSRRPPREARSAASAADPGHLLAIFEIDDCPRFARGIYPPPDGSPEQGQGLGEADDPVLRDLLGLERHAAEAGVVERSAIKQEPSFSTRRSSDLAEIHARQAAAGHVKAALFADLTPARLPRRFPIGLHDAAGNGPARLVGRLDDEEPALAVTDHCAGRRGDRRDDIPDIAVRRLVTIDHASQATPGLQRARSSSIPHEHPQVDSVGHGLAAGIVRVQVVAAVVAGVERGGMAGVRDSRGEVDDAVERVAGRDPDVDVGSRLLGRAAVPKGRWADAGAKSMTPSNAWLVVIQVLTSVLVFSAVAESTMDPANGVI